MERIKSVCREMGLEDHETDRLRSRCGTWTRVLAVGETEERRFRKHTFHRAWQLLCPEKQANFVSQVIV